MTREVLQVFALYFLSGILLARGVKEEMKKNIKHLTKTPGQSATVSPICEITEKRRKRAENALAKVTATNTRHSLEKEINAALNLVESDDSSDMPLTQQHSTLPFVPPHSNSYPMYNAQYPPQYAPQYTMAPQPSTQLQQPEHHQQLWPGSQEIERGLSAKIDKLISSIENLSDRVEKLESNKPSGGEPEWTGKFIGGSLSLSEGQLATIKCLASSQNWQYTLRKVLSMLYDDKELAGMCAIGRKGAQHQAVDKEDLGALKAQPDLSSSMLPGRNFVCPNEIVTYSCSGISTLIDWYTPPLLNESDSLRYAVTSIPGTVEPSPEASIRSNLVRGSPNFLTELTVDGSVDTDLSIICRFGNSSAAFVETSLDHNIQRTPTPPANIALNNIDVSFNGGCQIVSWTLPAGNFDVSQFTLEVYTQGRLVNSVRLNSTVTSLLIGVLGPLGTSSQVALYTHTLCGDVSGPGYSNFQSTRLSPSTLAALTVPVLLVFAIAVALIVILVSLLVCRCTSNQVDTQHVEMSEKSDDAA